MHNPRNPIEEVPGVMLAGYVRSGRTLRLADVVWIMPDYPRESFEGWPVAPGAVYLRYWTGGALDSIGSARQPSDLPAIVTAARRDAARTLTRWSSGGTKLVHAPKGPPVRPKTRAR